MGQQISKAFIGVGCAVAFLGGVALGIAAAVAAPLTLGTSVGLFALSGMLTGMGVSGFMAAIDDKTSLGDIGKCMAVGAATGLISGAVMGPLGYWASITASSSLTVAGSLCTAGAIVGVVNNSIGNAINSTPIFQNVGTAALVGGVSGLITFGTVKTMSSFLPPNAPNNVATHLKQGLANTVSGAIGGTATSAVQVGISKGDSNEIWKSTLVGASTSLISCAANIATSRLQRNVLKLLMLGFSKT